MNVIKTAIPEVLIIEPKVFGDQRGLFLETFQTERYAAHGVARLFVQDNLSRSNRGVLRGLHLQNPRAQGKLVSAFHGRVLDVAVDVRVGPADEIVIRWNDPAIGINWGIDAPTLAARDTNAPLLSE